uniref:Uncharacterized protein n=1 Tax=Anguilla anguilla TaxID=7936 RepID=A0A0E9PAM6_ANGAN
MRPKLRAPVSVLSPSGTFR